MSAAFGDFYAKTRLHLLEAGRQGRLRDVAELGSAREVLRVRECHKEPHLAKGCHTALWLSKLPITKSV